MNPTKTMLLGLAFLLISVYCTAYGVALQEPTLMIVVLRPLCLWVGIVLVIYGFFKTDSQ